MVEFELKISDNRSYPVFSSSFLKRLTLFLWLLAYYP